MMLEDKGKDGTDEVDPDRHQSDANEPVTQAAVRWRAGAQNVADLPRRIAKYAQEIHLNAIRRC